MPRQHLLVDVAIATRIPRALVRTGSLLDVVLTSIELILVLPMQVPLQTHRKSSFLLPTWLYLCHKSLLELFSRLCTQSSKSDSGLDTLLNRVQLVQSNAQVSRCVFQLMDSPPVMLGTISLHQVDDRSCLHLA